jgi:Iap family predicted aminopeptidase
VRAANYITSVFEDAGLSVRDQSYEYYDQRVTNLLATVPANAGVSTYYVVGAHYDTVSSTSGADDNASAIAVMLELAGRLRRAGRKAPVLLAAFTLEEPPAYLTGHQGSRIFVRSCQRNFDRVLGDRIEIVGYENVQFTKAPSVLRGMGMTHLSKNKQAIKELAAKGMASN